MSLFEHNDFDNHEKVAFFRDPQTGLQAIIAIHNTQLGASLGGCRMWQYNHSAEALSDVLRLSKGMSYKAAMANLPQGGGKAVIIGDPRKPKSADLLQAMGRFVDSMQGDYIIAEDSGISVQDINIMASQTAFVSGNKARYSLDGLPADGNPAPATALGVFCGIKAAVEFAFNSSLEGKKIAIQGVGHVGLRLAKYLFNAGAQLYVSDIHQDNLLIAEKLYQATIVDNKEIHNLPVDVFSPCALGNAINNSNINSIQAKIIAGAANNQLANDILDKTLYDKNIVYVPDYVINAGGIIDIYHQGLTISSDEKLRQQIKSIGSTVSEILNQSRQSGLGTQTFANTIAESRFLMGK